MKLATLITSWTVASAVCPSFACDFAPDATFESATMDAALTGRTASTMAHPVELADAEADARREACPAIGSARDCEEGEGTQFCAGVEGRIVWGKCLADFSCMPGKSEGCLLIDGVPQLRQDVVEVITDAGATSIDMPAETDPVLSGDTDESGDASDTKGGVYTMRPHCYGGSGYTCCDYYECAPDYVCSGCCAYSHTECESP